MIIYELQYFFELLTWRIIHMNSPNNLQRQSCLLALRDYKTSEVLELRKAVFVALEGMKTLPFAEVLSDFVKIRAQTRARVDEPEDLMAIERHLLEIIELRADTPENGIYLTLAIAVVGSMSNEAINMAIKSCIAKIISY